MTGQELDEIVATIVAHLEEAGSPEGTVVSSKTTDMPGEFEVVLRVANPRGHDVGIRAKFILTSFEEGALRSK